MGNYSGNLIRSSANATETANFQPDPRHAQSQTPDPYGAVHQVSADLGAEYDGTDFPSDVMIGGGSVLGTPLRTHQGMAGKHMVYTDDQHRESLSERHGEDGQRSYVRATYNLPPLQDTHSEYSDAFTHDETWGETENNVGATAILRGNKTAIPQNNPNGVREGMIRRTWFKGQRRLGRRRYIYQPQQLFDRATYRDANVPAPANPDATGAGSVLQSWPAYKAKTSKVPGMWTRPQDIDSDTISTPTVGNSDVIGGGF